MKARGYTTNSRKLSITCAANSGTNAACKSTGNGSGYFVVVIIPNNNGGSFIDSNYSTTLGNGPITSCASLWTAINAAPGNRPTDILAYYQGDPAAGDFVTCDDTNGCTATSKNCFSAWDVGAQTSGGNAATIPNGSCLACAFLDTPYSGNPAQGSPPTAGVGLVGISASTAFATATFTSPGQNPISFGSWRDY